MSEEYRPDTPHDFGDLFTKEEYLEACQDGGFVDSDGFGHPGDENYHDSDLFIKPSDGDKNIPEEATHVVWYNR